MATVESTTALKIVFGTMTLGKKGGEKTYSYTTCNPTRWPD